jgi:ATP-binding cassette subfamily B protein
VEGEVRFDHQDLRDVSLASLRAQIGVVFQDTFVFDTTLRENIAIGLSGATDAEVAAAAEAARLGDYVSALPYGFDTVLGERGVRMSGGQRQRLAIARVLLRDPPVLLLDEATSALDARTERGILDTLAGVTKGRTTISITHRLAMAAEADRVFVIDRGRCVEEGPHRRLVTAGGLYQRLYEEQSGSLSAEGEQRVGLEAARMQVVPLFAGLGREALASLAKRLRLERFDAGEEVVRGGEPGDRLFVIGHGEAEVLIGEGDGARRVSSLGEGDYFGESALLTGEPRAATVRTTVPSDLYSLEREDFVSLLQGHPDIRRSVEETLAARRGALETLMAKMSGPGPAGPAEVRG